LRRGTDGGLGLNKPKTVEPWFFENQISTTLKERIVLN
ncbi:unnamed protein product, partial [Allacma fusca]